MKDSELIRQLGAPAHGPNPAFQELVQRHAAWIFRSAQRQSQSTESALAVTQAVFTALLQHGPKLSRKTVLSDWLFRLTHYASALQTKRDRAAANRKSPKPTGIESRFDARLFRLSTVNRAAIVSRLLQGQNSADAALDIARPEKSLQRSLAAGLKALARNLRKVDRTLTPDSLTHWLLSVSGPEATPLPDDLAQRLEGPTPPPIHALAQAALRKIRWERPRGAALFLAKASACVVVFFGVLFGVLAIAWQSGHLQVALMEWGMRQAQAGSQDDTWPPAEPLVDWDKNPGNPRLNAAQIKKSEDLFQITNIWSAHFRFSESEWTALGPKRIPPAGNFMKSDGKIVLVNPKATRNGLAGTVGLEFPWSTGRLDFGGVTRSNVSMRFKGNGTYLGEAHRSNRPKRPFKIDLARGDNDQSLGKVEVLNFGNLTTDASGMADALAYDYFRAAGVPASRTAYAFVHLTIDGRFENRPLGLYIMVENLDKTFLKREFNGRKIALFKPVTYDLFLDLGEDWAAYDRMYDPKNKMDDDAKRRVIEFAKLMTHADDATFASKVHEFLNLEAFARFLAALSLQSSYDGFFTNGQNFFMYLDTTTGQFGFIPWDLDHSWGGFPFTGTPEDRQNVSVFHPWIGEHRLLERVMKVDVFRKIYRNELERQLTTLFTPDRIEARMNEVARVVRAGLESESPRKVRRFDQAITKDPPPAFTENGNPFDPNRPPHQIKRFVEARAKAVRAQLDGVSGGVILPRQGPGQPAQPSKPANAVN